jgi:hypothetical protein
VHIVAHRIFGFEDGNGAKVVDKSQDMAEVRGTPDTPDMISFSQVGIKVADFFCNPRSRFGVLDRSELTTSL